MHFEAPSVENTLVWVHTWKARDGKLAPCLASIEASDIGKNYCIYRQPDDESDRAQFHIEAWRRAAALGKSWVLRLEDDVRVCSTIIERLSKWGAIHRDKFGLGWLSYPKSVMGDQFRLGYDGPFPYRRNREMHHSFGVLVRSDFVAPLTRSMETLKRQYRAGEYDLLLSSATNSLGKLVYLHTPGLVTTDTSLPSSLGNRVFPSWYYSFEEN